MINGSDNADLFPISELEPCLASNFSSVCMDNQVDNRSTFGAFFFSDEGHGTQSRYSLAIGNCESM